MAEALAALGVGTAAAHLRAVTVEDLAAADIVVTMKPGLTLPGPVRRKLIEWEFPDPDSWGIDRVRDLRDLIHASVQQLIVRPVHR